MASYLVYLVFFCVHVISSNAEEKSYKGHQVWRIVPSDVDDLRVLKELGDVHQVDFWKEPTGIGKPVDFLVRPEQSDILNERLLSNGISDIHLHISDVQSLIEEGGRHRRDVCVARATVDNIETFAYTEYHPMEEINDWMDMVVRDYPFATKTQIGTTFQGRSMYALEFKKASGSDGSKPKILVDALIHCREWITTASLLFIFKEMLLDVSLEHMINDVDWYFVPVINIDGFVETWTGNRLWRKTRSTGPSSICTGVDANRNWDAYWSGVPGASADPCSFMYHGPKPWSESEIRHLKDYVLSLGVGNIDAYVSTHSYSQLILYPYNYAEDATAANEVELRNVGMMIGDAMQKIHGTKYVVGPGATALYPFTGTTSDWTYDVAKANLSYTFELRDKGEYGFLLPADQIVPTGQEYLAGLETLKKYVVDNYDGGSGSEPRLAN